MSELKKFCQSTDYRPADLMYINTIHDRTQTDEYQRRLQEAEDEVKRIELHLLADRANNVLTPMENTLEPSRKKQKTQNKANGKVEAGCIEDEVLKSSEGIRGDDNLKQEKDVIQETTQDAHIDGRQEYPELEDEPPEPTPPPRKSIRFAKKSLVMDAEETMKERIDLTYESVKQRLPTLVPLSVKRKQQSLLQKVEKLKQLQPETQEPF